VSQDENLADAAGGRLARAGPGTAFGRTIVVSLRIIRMTSVADSSAGIVMNGSKNKE